MIRFFSHILLFVSIFFYFHLTCISSMAIITVQPVPSAVLDIRGIHFFGTIICDDGDEAGDPPVQVGGGCESGDWLEITLIMLKGVQLPPSSLFKEVSIEFIDDKGTVIVPLSYHPIQLKTVSGVEYTTNKFPISFSKTTDPKAFIQYNGFLSLDTQDFSLLSQQPIRLAVEYQPLAYVESSASVSDAKRLEWYRSGLVLDTLSIHYIPQTFYKINEHDSLQQSTKQPPQQTTRQPQSTAQLIPTSSTNDPTEIPNWTIEIIIKSVPITPFQIDIHFYGDFTFSTYPTCLINGSSRLRVTSKTSHHPQRSESIKNDPIQNGDKIRHLTLFLGSPGTDFFDVNNDLYIQCTHGFFSLPATVHTHPFFATAVIISNQESILDRYNVPTSILPYSVYLPLQPLKQITDFNKFHRDKLIIPRVQDLTINPTVTTSKSQLDKVMQIEVQYYFEPMDSTLHHENISPGILYRSATWETYHFELEIIWTSQERLMIDANWSLLQNIHYKDPLTTTNSLNTYKMISDGKILASRFQQHNAWVSSPFTISVLSDNFNQTNLASSFILSQTPILQLHMTVHHDDFPPITQQQYPTILLHTHHLESSLEPLSLLSMTTNHHKKLSTQHVSSQLLSISQQQQQPLPIFPAVDQVDLGRDGDDDNTIWLNRTVPISHFRFGDFQLKTLSKDLEMRSFWSDEIQTNLQSSTKDDSSLLLSPQLGKKSRYIIGHGFNMTFSTDISLLYKDFSTSRLFLDLTDNVQYQFNQWTANTRCWWNGFELSADNFVDQHGRTIASTDYSRVKDAEGLFFVYQQLEFILPPEHAINYLRKEYSFHCAGPFIIPTASHSGKFVSDPSRFNLRLRVFYDDGLIPKLFTPINDLHHTMPENNNYESYKLSSRFIQLVHEVSLNFGDDPLNDEKSFRIFILLMIAIPVSFVLAGGLVWKRYKNNQRHRAKRTIVEEPNLGSPMQHQFPDDFASPPATPLQSPSPAIYHEDYQQLE